MAKKEFSPDNKVAYDRNPIQLKVLPGVRERLKSIPDWQTLLRAKIDEIISTHHGSSD